MGILLQWKRQITALEIEQIELLHLVAQLLKGQHSRNCIHVHSINSNFGKPVEDNTVRQLLENVETMKTLMDLAKEAVNQAMS